MEKRLAGCPVLLQKYPQIVLATLQCNDLLFERAAGHAFGASDGDLDLFAGPRPPLSDALRRGAAAVDRGDALGLGVPDGTDV